MFSLMAMTLLEQCCRVARADPTGAALRDFSSELARIEPRYFTQLPGCAQPPNAFDLLSLPGRDHPERQLSWALFDLMRNGHTHIYQQSPAHLHDGSVFGISVTGVEPGVFLESMTVDRRPRDHLEIRIRDKETWVVVMPGAPYVDLRDAAVNSRLFQKGLVPGYLTRGKAARRKSTTYRFDAAELRQHLADAGHPVTEDPR